MDINFKEITIYNWDGIKLKADADEAPEDIIAAVLYSDHGDDFLVVKTADKIYEYGWWLDRPCYGYDLLDENTWRNRDEFIKLPKLYGKLDKHSDISNKIYSLMKDCLYETTYFMGWRSDDRLKENLAPSTAQWYFDRLYDGLKEYYDTNVVFREWNDRIETITNYLMSNDIMTEENLKKLEDIKIFLRIGAIDGCAGKMDISGCQYVDGDCLSWIWYKGKQVTKKYHKHGIKVKGYTTYDEFGYYDRFRVDLDRLNGV